MLNSLGFARHLAPALSEALNASRVVQNLSLTQNLIISGRAHLSFTARAWKEDKKPELFIDQVLRDFDGRGVRHSGADVASENAFKLFELDEKLMIDEVRLKREMIKLQRLIHPDRYMKTGRETQVKTERLSSLVNESYEILRHPYKRAKYLLGLRWNKSQDEIEARMDRLELDPDFLSNMMDLRELISNTNDLQELLKMSSRIQTDVDDLILDLDRGFKSGNYESILEKLGKLKFVANCYMALTDRLTQTGNF